MYTKDKEEGKSQSNQSASAIKFIPISGNFAKADVSSVAVVVFICDQDASLIMVFLGPDQSDAQAKTFQPDLDLFQTGCWGLTGRIFFEVNLFDRFRFVPGEETPALIWFVIFIQLCCDTPFVCLQPYDWLLMTVTF